LTEINGAPPATVKGEVMTETGQTGQDEIIRFLSDPQGHGLDGGTVERFETHGALVFLAGDTALKIKKAVKLPYFDFSTLALREKACRHELELNQPHAPEIYRDVVAITREADGGLKLGGSGEPVEWAVRMRRFRQDRLLSALARQGPIARDLVHDLARTVAEAHRTASVIEGAGIDYIARVVRQVRSTLPPRPDVFDAGLSEQLAGDLERALKRTRHLLRYRARTGSVRLCHGDMHLNNLVLIDRRPVLFDALEFDDSLASIDRLYDLAFLLMDLMEAGQGHAASLLLNRYLHEYRCEADLLGLATLPLFLACRAAVRAIVTADRFIRKPGGPGADDRKIINDYLELACGCIRPPKPRLVAIGGFSGTGKSTLAAALTPLIWPRPGAVHLRSDLERKALFGVQETARLHDSAYAPDVTERVYATLMRKARRTLAAGHAVIVDAVFARENERQAVEAVAKRMHVPFHGLWLTAPRETLAGRVTSRIGDASDATAAVVERQLGHGAGAVRWHEIDAGGSAEQTLAIARASLR
jgi:hypothetical protein